MSHFILNTFKKYIKGEKDKLEVQYQQCIK